MSGTDGGTPKETLKILVSAFACDPQGGSEFNTGFYFSRYLADAGHDVWCITTPKGRAHIEASGSLPDNLHFMYVSVPSWLEKFYRFTTGMYFYYLYWQRRAAGRAKALDRVVNFDLIHHITWGSVQLGSGMWRVGKPLFFGPVGGGQYSPSCFFPYFGKALPGEFLRWLIAQILVLFSADFRQTLRHARCVIVSNDDTERLARRHGAGDRVVFLADPALPTAYINRPARHCPQEGRQLRLLWVGRMFPRKGLGFTLNALALVPPNVDWCLTIVGYGPLENKIREKIKALKLENRIVWRGRLPWPETQEMYLGHDAFIFTPFRESVGAQLLEAMANGMPLIVLDIHGAHTFVPEGAGLKVKVTTARATMKAVAEAVVAFSALSPAQRIAMNDVCRETARNYSWASKIAHLEELYRMCC